MENTTIPDRIIHWLRERGISNDVISSRLGWNGTHIVIPIFGKDGSVLFNKYRKDPEDLSDSPKYLYDKGATAALYGIDRNVTSPRLGFAQNTVYLCEGELDALRLMSADYAAFSTTGGSGTFLDEWAILFSDSDVVVCYDNDEAGIKGAIKVQVQIPHARLLALPQGEWKDVTEFLQKNTTAKFDMLVDEAKSYFIPLEPETVIESKKQIKETVDALKTAVESCMLALREANQKQRGDYDILYVLRQYLLARFDHYTRLLKSWDRTGVSDGPKVVRAKGVPVTQFLIFNRQGFCKCLWHTDSRPSLFYNKENSKFPNTVKCFSCGFKGDVIDVIMKLRGCTFKEAVNELAP